MPTHPTNGYSSTIDGTFRDPQGKLLQQGGRILREIYPQHTQAVLSWIQSPLAQRWFHQKRMVPTVVLKSGPGEPVQLEHERVFFPSYPWEWTPRQWISAGRLTLDLCEEAVEQGYILKDATPLNILFSGAQPVFVDVLSFGRRDPAIPLWIAYGQFVRTFLLPLAAYVHLGWPLAASLQRRDGYEPADLAPWLGFTKRWSSPLRSLVTLPMVFEKNFFQQKMQSGSRSHSTSEEAATWTLHRTLRSTRKLLDSLSIPEHASRWSAYTGTASHYSNEEQSAKQEFVRRVLRAEHPAHVLDVGANTGVYSRIAAESGAEVVGWDSDIQASDLSWQIANRDRLTIQPMIADFARPTPAVGWRNGECASLLARARGRFDCVLMLGILHHLLIADQIPLEAIVDQLAEISIRFTVLEFIPKNDSQFIALCRGREELYAHIQEESFMKTIEKRFIVRESGRLKNGRSLWHLEKIA